MRTKPSWTLGCWLCALLAGLFWMIAQGSVARAADPAENNSTTEQNATTEKQAAVEETPDRYEFREDHDPNGIGKFYLGREIAHVMGFAAAPWLERPEREREEQTTKMVKALGLKPGMVVADIGAGSGVITLMMAAQVGSKGKAYAVDIQQEMLDLLADKLNRFDISNIELTLATELSPELPPNVLDLAIMVDVYHELEYPFEYMQALSRCMKPGGRVVLVEFRKEDPEVPIKLVHKMTVAQAKRELGQPELGLKWKETIGVLPWQHIIVFEKRAMATTDEAPPK
jgi:precorrin-6B methylase 2